MPPLVNTTSPGCGTERRRRSRRVPRRSPAARRARAGGHRKGWRTARRGTAASRRRLRVASASWPRCRGSRAPDQATAADARPRSRPPLRHAAPARRRYREPGRRVGARRRRRTTVALLIGRRDTDQEELRAHLGRWRVPHQHCSRDSPSEPRAPTRAGHDNWSTRIKKLRIIEYCSARERAHVERGDVGLVSVGCREAHGNTRACRRTLAEHDRARDEIADALVALRADHRDDRDRTQEDPDLDQPEDAPYRCVTKSDRDRLRSSRHARPSRPCRGCDRSTASPSRSDSRRGSRKVITSVRINAVVWPRSTPPVERQRRDERQGDQRGDLHQQVEDLGDDAATRHLRCRTPVGPPRA